MNKYACLILFFIFLVGCAIPKEESLSRLYTTEIHSEENNYPINVYFCPRDNCSSYLIELVENAESSVHCAFFELNIFNLIQVLDRKSNSIDVRIVVDTDYEDEVSGDFVRFDKRSAYMHNKFCIIDGEIITTGSMNPTVNCDTKNNNNLLVIHSKLLSENYEQEFSELWGGVFGKGGKVLHPAIDLNRIRIRNYFCPEDYCANNLVKELDEAQKSIYFMTFSFDHDKVGDEVIKQFNSGVDVRGVFETRQKSKYSEIVKFNATGISVIPDKNPATMHHKVFIIDGKTVVTGSFNPSNNADKSNDENIIVIDDERIAQQFMEEFEYVYGLK